MRIYVPQQGEKGAGAGQAGEPVGTQGGLPHTRPAGSAGCFGKNTRKRHAQKFCGTAGGSGASGGVWQHRPMGLRSDSGRGRWQGTRLWNMAMGWGLCCQPRPEGAVSTRALLRRSPTPCQASGTRSLEQDHHSDGVCRSLLGPLRTHAIQGGRAMTVHGRQQPEQVASSARGRGRGVSKTAVCRETPSVHHIRQHECVA